MPKSTIIESRMKKIQSPPSSKHNSVYKPYGGTLDKFTDIEKNNKRMKSVNTNDP